MIDLVEERDRNIARVHDALRSAIVIQNRSTRKGLRVHCLPYLLQCLVSMAGQHGGGHYRSRVKPRRVTPRRGEYADDMATRDHSNSDTVAIAHHHEGRISSSHVIGI